MFSQFRNFRPKENQNWISIYAKHIVLYIPKVDAENIFHKIQIIAFIQYGYCESQEKMPQILPEIRTDFEALLKKKMLESVFKKSLIHHFPPFAEAGLLSSVTTD